MLTPANTALKTAQHFHLFSMKISFLLAFALYHCIGLFLQELSNFSYFNAMVIF